MSNISRDSDSSLFLCPCRPHPERANKGANKRAILGTRAASLLFFLFLLLFHAAIREAAAADCPVDKFSLWTSGALHGANVFQGRNPDGATNGLGDGDFTQSDYDDLALAGANYVHISHAGIFGEAPPYALDTAALANLDAVVDMALRSGLYIGIAFRSGPGRNENAISNRDAATNDAIWTNQAAQDAWAAMLGFVAARFRGMPRVVGLSVMVEPNAYALHGFPDPADFYATYGGTIQDVNRLYASATAAIRAVDLDIPILLEPEGYGNVPWLSYLTVTGDQRTVYTPHDYTPYDYTHGVIPNAAYPGVYDLGDGNPVLVNFSFLQNFLQTLKVFSNQNGVPVALTEFGVYRTASNTTQYLADRVAIQNTLGSWAIWVWQPAGFIDPFSVHQPSAVLNAMKVAWLNNCRPSDTVPGVPGGGGTGAGVLTGHAFKVSRRGRVGGAIANVSVQAENGARAVTGKRKKRAYILPLSTGMHTISASAKKLVCHIGSVDGPLSLNVMIRDSEATMIHIYCGKQ